VITLYPLSLTTLSLEDCSRMLDRRPRARLGVLSATLMALLSAGCGSDATPTAAGPSVTTSPAPATPDAPPATVEGLEDEVPPPDAGFPASIADDGGEERAGSEADAGQDMLITGLRLLPQNGYDRLIIDLNTSGIPFWTARYTEASTAAGEPIEVAGDAYLRVGLFTENSTAEPLDVVVGQSGVVAEVRSTGSLGGYQEVLIGVHGAPAPFRTFGLTDPGRIVVDIRPAG
jgi:hypothetical protein